MSFETHASVESDSLTVALVHNWPGQRNSELEIITRIKSILLHLDHVPTVIDPMGNILDSLGQRTKKSCVTNFDLVLNFHYLNPNVLGKLSYAVNWNPLQYLTQDPTTRDSQTLVRFRYICDSLKTHHRILSAGSSQLDRFVALLRDDEIPEPLENMNLYLHTTVERPPNADSNSLVSASTFKVFYIGINWEKLSSAETKRVRHDGLFEHLDHSGDFQFYGLERQNDVPLWEGIESYRGELPFDGGASILNATRECGVTLVLSSDQHRSSGVVSTRIFQACAAGAIIISDKNRFIQEAFGDSVLYFDYGDTPQETAKNILSTVAWVRDNWDQAKSKACRCQDIFASKFELQTEVSAICAQAARDLTILTSHRDSLNKHSVTIIYRIRQFDVERWDQFSNNLHRQHQKAIEVAIILDSSADYSSVESRLCELPCPTTLEYSCQTIGEYLACKQSVSSDYWLVYSEGFEWSPEHISGLLGALVGTHHIASYTPLFINYLAHIDSLDTTDYFIRGVPNDFEMLSRDKVANLDMSGVALGNIMLTAELLLRAREKKTALEFLDTASVIALLRDQLETTGKPPTCLPRLSSSYTVSLTSGRIIYNEYDLAGGAEMQIRDRNILALFYQPQTTDSSKRLSSAKKKWELADAGILVTEDFDKSLYSLYKKLEILQESIETGSFSTRFAPTLYVRQALRNRPLLLSLFNATVRFFSKLLGN